MEEESGNWQRKRLKMQEQDRETETESKRVVVTSVQKVTKDNAVYISITYWQREGPSVGRYLHILQLKFKYLPIWLWGLRVWG